MNLALKGHKSRGIDVIKLLEMLGGKNIYNLTGAKEIWYILSNNTIEHSSYLFEEKGFTIEEFLEKFPYKVGDKVIYTPLMFPYSIKKMRWDAKWNSLYYTITNNDGMDVSSVSAENLQPYKEEPMEEKKDLDWYPTDYLDFVDNDDTWADEVELNLGDSYEIQVRDGKTFAVKKKPQYPKTYDECKSIIVESEGCDAGPAAIAAEVFANIPVTDFCKLIVVRNAYWKIAGDWKYDVNKTEEYFYIVNKCGCIVKEHYMNFNHILVFPTEEMRNAFYENFKELIEQCKELL